MIKITQKKNCCGCSACVQACPRNCITMREDGEGFFYPVVDKASCVDCGLCERVCPILNASAADGQTVTAFAAYTKDDEVRRNSSSGGIFTELAERILELQGVVFGAAFAEDFSVRHIKIERREDLELLRGSKYVQSWIGDTYNEAKQLLRAGRIVLFSGVSCQIAGLKTFLGRDYDNLYTVDVLCHGVPSSRLWRWFLQTLEQRKGAKAESISFRDKTPGWKHYSVEVTFENGEQYSKIHQKNTYIQCFIKNICLRPSCHSCRFKDVPRLSDLTIGDAWGIEKHMPDMDDDGGTSVVLVNSAKGQKLWEDIAPELCVRQGEADVLLPKEAESRFPVRPHPNRKRFFAALDRGADPKQLLALLERPALFRLASWGKRCLKQTIRKIRGGKG